MRETSPSLLEALAKLSEAICDWQAQVAAQPQVRKLPSVLISGEIRCGKSIIAERVSRKTGRVHICCDPFVRAYSPIEDLDHRLSVKRVMFFKTALAFPHGAVIEGAQMAHRLEGPPGKKDDRVDITLLWELCRVTGLEGFLIISGDDSVEKKHEGLQRFRATGRCWTRHDDRPLTDHAASILRRSHRIRRQARSLGIPCLETHSEHFEADVRAHSDAIIHRSDITAPKPV